MKYVFLFLALVVLPEFLNAQILGSYSNIGHVDEEVFQGYTSDYAGFDRVLPSRRAWTINPEDSNAYSVLSVGLGQNLNQSIRASLDRPIGDKARFFMEFTRESYPGWVTNSFGKYSDWDSRFSSRLNEKQELSLDFSVRRDSRGANWGVPIDSSYSIEQSLDGFSALYSDVYSSNGLSDELFVVSDLTHKIDLYQTDSANWNIRSNIGLNWDSWRFEDESVSTIYYEQLLAPNVTSFRDSVKMLIPHAGFTLDHRRSLERMDVSLSTGAVYELIDLKNNSNETLLHNLKLEANGELASTKVAIHGAGYYIPLGFNQGDAKIDADFIYLLGGQLDSNSFWQSSFSVDAGFWLKEPSYKFYRYSSSILSYKNEFDKELITRAGAKWNFNRDSLLIELGSDITLFQNRIYIDSNFAAVQAANAFYTNRNTLSVRYASRHWVIHPRATYQLSSASDVFSIPELVADFDVAFKFGLFKHKMGIRLGSEGGYYSTYFARGYLPFIDEYFVQSNRQYGNVVMIHPYVSAKINSLSIKLQMINATYGIFSDDPMIAPGYSMVPRFGVLSATWKFKN